MAPSLARCTSNLQLAPLILVGMQVESAQGVGGEQANPRRLLRHRIETLCRNLTSKPCSHKS